MSKMPTSQELVLFLREDATLEELALFLGISVTRLHRISREGLQCREDDYRRLLEYARSVSERRKAEIESVLGA